MLPVGDGLALVLFVRKHGHDASVVKPIKNPLLTPQKQKMIQALPTGVAMT